MQFDLLQKGMAIQNRHVDVSHNQVRARLTGREEGIEGELTVHDVMDADFG
ncbi:hypothetical protein MF271_23200 (plasmid) [Deinococcus sp. KNUC1210]|uniref:hypothetical protein n=1 Tax=Deinococcus sp. KNUC1210 TaxID=2917691 RepID=UPI001EF03B04|nr:hypothetical protein [Deinococcus sp. KNUC1210]ULH17885.1 hypothetical protein MF271_23200 [Deinococcus sp. KNUC1210]